MTTTPRRHFLKASLAGAGYWMTSRLVPGGDPLALPNEALHSDLVELGKTGIKVSRLAQGTGYNGSGRYSDHSRLGLKTFEAMVRHSFEKGISFMDTADLYGTHQYLRTTLKGIPRDRYVVMSKIWPKQEYWNAASGGAVEEVNRFRRELAVDTIEVCLMHCMTDDKWAESYKRIRDELSELKQKGVVRAVGVSCHNFGALKVAAAHPWVDVILARINYKGGPAYAMDGTAEEISAVLKEARANGKAIIGMKIFGGGKLVQPEEKDTSLKYVWGNKLVDAITVGTLSIEQVDDTIARLNQALKTI